MGDADIVHTDMEQSHANTEFAVRKILAAGATPLILGGDHSIHDPVMAVGPGSDGQFRSERQGESTNAMKKRFSISCPLPACATLAQTN